MKLLFLPFLLCIAVLSARPAEAVRAYADGGLQSNGTLCPVTGNAVTVLQSYAGYFTDPVGRLAAVVHAVATAGVEFGGV